jgi:hypothetical protein
MLDKSDLKAIGNIIDERFGSFGNDVDNKIDSLARSTAKGFEVMQKGFDTLQKGFGTLQKGFMSLHNDFEEHEQENRKEFAKVNNRFDEMMTAMDKNTKELQDVRVEQVANVSHFNRLDNDVTKIKKQLKPV